MPTRVRAYCIEGVRVLPRQASESDSITHSPVPDRCLGPSRVPALGDGAESVQTSTRPYRRISPKLHRPGSDAFLRLNEASTLGRISMAF